MDEFISRLQDALRLPLPGDTAHQKLAPYRRNIVPENINPRLSAVMCLIYPDEGVWKCVLIKRNAYNGTHSAQVSFPGGSADKNDLNLIHTAIRETHEEIGVVVESGRVIGQLTPVYIPPSNFLVQPVIGWLPEKPRFVPDPREVNFTIHFDLLSLTDPALQQTESVKMSNGLTMKVPCFLIENEVVWGATAVILSELRDIIQRML